MSARYVYGIYNTTADKRLTKELDVATTDSNYPTFLAEAAKDYLMTIAQDRQGNPVTYYKHKGPVYPPSFTTIVGNSAYRPFTTDVIDYPFIIISRVATSSTGGGTYVSESYLLETAPNSGSKWHMRRLDPSKDFADDSYGFWNNNYRLDVANPGEEQQDKERLYFYVSGGIIAQGASLLETVSSGTSLETGSFDDNGTLKWRVYKGSDTIDPTAVTYSKTELYPGDTVTITVSARTPAYGGTVYYQYQYTTDGTTWVNLGGRTTSTTASFTVPEDAEHFQARVLASDGWGFTSTTYVNGPSLGVSQLKAYGTVSGTIRALKKGWCVVGGTVKSLERGYVTVNGVWKKIF